MKTWTTVLLAMLALAPAAHADKPRKEAKPRRGNDALVERRLSLLFAPGPKPELVAALRTVRPGALLSELSIAAPFTMRDQTHIAHPDLEVGPRRAAAIRLELGAKAKDRIDVVRLSINGNVIRLLAKRWGAGHPSGADEVEWLVKEEGLRVVAREVGVLDGDGTYAETWIKMTSSRAVEESRSPSEGTSIPSIPIK